METSEEICEALVRHCESMGSEVFEKNFIRGGKIICTVYCMLGANAEAFQQMAAEWLAAQGYTLDP